MLQLLDTMNSFYLRTPDPDHDTTAAAAVAAFDGDINERLVRLLTPLETALFNCQIKAIHALGARGDVSVIHAGQILYFACLGPDRGMEALLRAFPGLDVNARIVTKSFSVVDQAETALHIVVRFNRPAMVDMLLDAWADPSATNAFGETPGAVARRYGYHGLRERLDRAMHCTNRRDWLLACVSKTFA